MDIENKGFLKFSENEKLMPQAEMLEVRKQKSSMTVGVPKEISYQENRIALVPEAVGMLVNNGHTVYIESNAGNAAHFNDSDYSNYGATIVYTPDEVYKADVILKVAPPLSSEVDKLKQRQLLFSALHLAGQSEDYFKKLVRKKTTAISYEDIKDKSNSFPVIRSLSEIAGVTSIFIASEYLSSADYGKGRILGGFSGITPSEVVVIGAGTVGEFAVRTAIGVGAQVKIFDNSVYKLRSIQYKVNTRLFTSIIHQEVLLNSLKSADVVIGALHAVNGRTQCVVSEDMVKQMQEGSVIVDVSISQGGCFETSRITNHSNPVYKKHGVTHYCVPNIASRVPHTASYALSNFFAPMILTIGEEGGIDNLLKKNSGIRQSVYLYNGILTNKYISDMFNIPFQDINLLMAAFG
jgi:alanine dehydrogenase